MTCKIPGITVRHPMSLHIGSSCQRRVNENPRLIQPLGRPRHLLTVSRAVFGGKNCDILRSTRGVWESMTNASDKSNKGFFSREDNRRKVLTVSARILACVLLFVLGVATGAAGVMVYKGNKIAADCRMFSSILWSDWEEKSWRTYMEEKPEVAVWALERLTEYYQERIDRYGFDEDLTFPTDVVRVHAMIAISAKKLGDEQKYRHHIEKALSVAKASDNKQLRELKTEEDVIVYQKKWEQLRKKTGSSVHSTTGKTACKPAENRKCACENGATGSQYCGSDGSGWEKCSCFVDGLEL